MDTMKKSKYIAVDFDGTCVTHEYPNIGKCVGAIPVLTRIASDGHKIILFTMRSGEKLDDAVKWFAENGIPLFGINENPTQKAWTQSPKPYAHVYIDDAALGCPLMMDDRCQRPFVDWQEIEHMLKKIDVL